MFEYKPLNNNYISLDEIREFLSRLMFDAILDYNIKNPSNTLFLQTKINAQGEYFNLKDHILENDSEIVVNVNTQENREIIYNHKASNSITIQAEIGVTLYNLENSRLRLDRMTEYIERAICFNNCYYQKQLTTAEGFLDKTYKCSLDKNRVITTTQITDQNFIKTNLQTQFKIEY